VKDSTHRSRHPRRRPRLARPRRGQSLAKAVESWRP
jgi:hypothetical protein